MDMQMLRKMTSPCGLPCFHCPAYLAQNNLEIRNRISEMLGVPPEKASCGGCRPQKGRIPVVNAEKTCQLFLCAQKHGVDFCHQCDDFPCERFQPYADQANFPHNTKMYQLCMMKKLGHEKWASEKAAKIWDTYRTEPFDFNNILY